MKVITYRVTLLESALVTSLQGDPNSAVAFDYLPGSVLRGIWIGKYLGSKWVDASDSTLQRLFFDGTTRYLNGYPLNAYDRPCLPVPMSWRSVKPDRCEIFDFAVEDAEAAQNIESQNVWQQWQPVSTPFYTQSDENVRLIQPERNVAVHTQRTARFGHAMPRYRPTGSDLPGGGGAELLKEEEIAGAVYCYDALAAGQSFQATIICDHDADATMLRPLMEGYVTLGGSRSGGYGQAEISQVQVHDHDPEREAVGDDENAVEGKLIVTLRSDALVRNEKGQFAVDPDLLCQVLSNHLRTKLELIDAFLGTQVIGGFNRKWRLPLPQALAVRMGSVLVFHDPGCDSSMLEMLESRGIGERRTEGFGRIVFNRQCIAKYQVEADVLPIRNQSSCTLDEAPARNLAELMVTRMLRRQLDEGLLAAANTAKIVNPPSNAQLSRLRSVILEKLYNKEPDANPDTSRICQFISSIEARGSARRQFERSTIKGTSLLSWLKKQLRYERNGASWTMRDDIWRSLLHLDRDKIGIAIGGVKANIDDSLRLEYVLRFMDLVLAHAAKQRGEEN